MTGMGKAQVLAKVTEDLRRGHYHPAMQRLASLTAAHPDDLELRARRAALYRQVGNVVDAGRWGFLSDDATTPEIAAFERAHPSAWRRLRLLRVNADTADHLGPVAGARLARLIEQAGAEGLGRVTWTENGPEPAPPGFWSVTFPCLVATAFGVSAVGLAVIGLVTVIRWIF